MRAFYLANGFDRVIEQREIARMPGTNGDAIRAIEALVALAEVAVLFSAERQAPAA